MQIKEQPKRVYGTGRNDRFGGRISKAYKARLEAVKARTGESDADLMIAIVEIREAELELISPNQPSSIGA